VKLLDIKFFFFVILALNCGHLSAQTVATDSTKLAIEPYQLTDVTSKLQETNQLIQLATDFHEDRKDIDNVQSDFFALDSALQLSLEKVDTASLSFSDANSLASILNGFSTRITGLEKILNDRTSDLDDFRKQRKVFQEQWEITLQALRDDNSSNTVLTNIEDILTSLNTTDKLLVDQIDVIFKTQNGITRSSVLLTNSLELLKSIESKTTQKIFNIDSSPIWKITEDSVSYNNFFKEISQNGRSAYINAKTYARQNLELIIINIIIILVLMFVIIFLKAKQERLKRYNDQKELWIMFNHPLGLAILLGLLVFSPRYEFFPEATADILVLLVYIMVTYILFPVIGKKAKVFLLILAFFLTFNTAMHFVSQYQIFGRVFLFLESIFGVYIIYSVIKPGFNSYNYFELPIARWMIYILPLGFLSFGLSAITNLLGASLFSEFLLYSTTKSVAFGILIFAGVLVLNGMITILLRSPQAKTVYIIKEHSEILESRTKQLLQLAMFAFFLVKLAQEFGVWDDIQLWFNTILDFDIAFGEREITFKGILAFFITIVISWWLARLLRLVLEKELFQRMNLPRGIPGAISSSVYYLIISVGFFLALSQSGVDLNQISIIVGALGVGIGFGLQGIISNFISGIILAFERPIQEGDTIEVGPLMGDVTSIGIRASKVRTFDGSEVIVPNNNLITNEVVNWTLSDRKRRSTIEIGVAYGNNPRTVSDLIEKEAINHAKTLKDPAPLVIFKGFGDSSLDFKLHFWTYFEDGYTSKSDVSMNVYDALNNAGIEIPFPQRVVTIKDETNEKEKNNPKKILRAKKSKDKDGPVGK